MTSSQVMRSTEDSVRIVYHTANRTFARLFDEDSLEEVKDVVRAKLDLGPETNVSLKQMIPDGLVDLEDDDDFRAFRVFVKSCVSVDIEVTLGASQTSERPATSMRAPSSTKLTVRQHSKSSSLGSSAPRKQSVPSRYLDDVSPEESAEEIFGDSTLHLADTRTTPSISQPLIRKQLTSNDHDESTTLDKPTEQRFSQSNAHPKAGRHTKAPSTPVGQKRPLPSNRGADEISEKPTEQHALGQPAATTPIATPKTTESLTTSRQIDADEPPKKKQKKELAKKKGVDDAEATASPSTEPLEVKTKSRKSTASTRAHKTATSTSKDGGKSEPPAKKPRKPKKDDGAGPKKYSAPADQEGDVDMNQPISEVGNLVDERSPRPDIEKPAKPSVKGSTLKTPQHKKIRAPIMGVCAAVPQTIASVCVESEVITAIMSSSLSKASETMPAEPPLKRKPVKRVTKRSTTSSKTSSRKPTAVLDVPANETPNTPVEHGSEQEVSTHGPPRQSPDVKGPPCPICLGEPFHIRYYCPTVLKGPDAVRERLEELKRTHAGDQLVLISQLECLLRDSEVTFVSSLNTAPTGTPQPGEALSPPVASLPRTPDIPTDSRPSKATKEIPNNRGSSESADEMSDGCIGPRGASVPQRQKPDECPSPPNDDLETVVRGPISEQRSILDLLDRIVGDEDEESDTEEEVQLEEDSDEDAAQSRRWSSKRPIHSSSDSESEEEESRSPSPSCSAAGTPNNRVLSTRSPEMSAEESARNQEGDVVMRDTADSSAPEKQHDDGSDGTCVGSEDRMVMDEHLGGRRMPIAGKEQALSHVPGVSILQPTSPSPESEESARIQNKPTFTPNMDGNTPAASEQARADPIEPADDLVPSSSRSPNTDPIEAPSDEVGHFFANVTQSTPKLRVSERMKARNGEILDEAERPVLLEQLASEATHANGVTPLLAREKSVPSIAETPASRELPSTRKSLRFNSPPASTPTPVVLLKKRRSKSGSRTSRAVKTPAKVSQKRSDVQKSSTKNGDGPGTTLTPATWETLAVPSSPSVQPDEPSMLVDELMPSSPLPDDTLNGSGKIVASSRTKTPKGKGRLFDLSASQIPFPYSQKKNLANPEPALLSNGNESDETEPEDAPLALQAAKAKKEHPARYRSLSQLASEARIFSPNFPTPPDKSATVGKTKKHVVTDSNSSSSSSSDEEDDGSEHIPQGRRAGSTLKKKKKSLLSGDLKAI